VIYQSSDDGRMAGVHAWTGSLRSSPMAFVIPPARTGGS
jgi:hypothetical protein